jgi:hypothetical protein
METQVNPTYSLYYTWRHTTIHLANIQRKRNFEVFSIVRENNSFFVPTVCLTHEHT